MYSFFSLFGLFPRNWAQWLQTFWLTASQHGRIWFRGPSCLILIGVLPPCPADTCLRSWTMGWPTRSTTPRSTWTSRGRTRSSGSRSWLSAWWPTSSRTRTTAMTSTSRTRVRDLDWYPYPPGSHGHKRLYLDFSSRAMGTFNLVSFLDNLQSCV